MFMYLAKLCSRLRSNGQGSTAKAAKTGSTGLLAE